MAKEENKETAKENKKSAKVYKNDFYFGTLKPLPSSVAPVTTTIKNHFATINRGELTFSYSFGLH